MIQKETNLVVADNSGARSVRAFQQKGVSFRKSSSIGDIITCAFKEAIPNSAFKKGDIVQAVIVRTKKEITLPDGSRIRFDDNAVVILKEDGTPKGTRVFGPVARELREKGEGFMKIISLAPEVL